MVSLTSLNLSNFDMSEVTDIGRMFNGCLSLTSLDLSNFQSNCLNRHISALFCNCPNLEYINLKNLNFSTELNIDLSSVKKNFVICNEDQGIISKIKGYECAIIDCSDNWRQNQKKINLENGECVDDCSLTNNSKYNYNNTCYSYCPDGTYNNNYKCQDCHPDCKTCEKGNDMYSTNCKSCCNPDKYLNFGNCFSECLNGYYNDGNDNSIKICKCDLIKCLQCSKESFEQDLCISCNDGYYPKFDDINNNNKFN